MPSCLLVVSHPDDDALFAGELQASLCGYTWTVVCVTGPPDAERSAELLTWQATRGTNPSNVHFLGFPDDPQDWREQRSSIAREEVEQRLAALDLTPDLVVTHNHLGEYGHPHHKMTHSAVTTVFGNHPTLVFGMGLPEIDLILPCPDKPRILREFFPSQRKAIRKLARTSERFARHRGPGLRETPYPPELQELFSQPTGG